MTSSTCNLRDFFLEYEPKEGVTSPTGYAHMTLLRHLLSVISCWPLKILDPLDIVAKRKRMFWVAIHKAFLTTICVTCQIGGILYVYLHAKTMSLFKLGHLYLSLLINFVILFKLVTLCFSHEYVVLVRTFLEKTHLFFYKDRSEYSMKVHKQVHFISHFFTLYLVCQTFNGPFLFNITPMFNNYIAGNYARGGLKGNASYEQALYFSYSFNVSTDLKGYILANFFHWVISLLTGAWFCMQDCILYLMVFHLWGHFKILLYNLDNFPRPKNKISFMIENTNVTNEMYSPSEQKVVSEELKKLIDYHRDITNFTDNISKVFGPILFIYYGFHQASGCLLLLECSQMPELSHCWTKESLKTAAALSRYLPLTIILYQQLIQLSIIFELIGSISDKLKFAVYGVPWESMNTKNRRTVAFFLMNVQDSVHVKALGVADVGVQSMTSILKVSVSYFTFLNSM